jgi:uncharacterized protein YjbI with pentapeptide repeats
MEVVSKFAGQRTAEEQATYEEWLVNAPTRLDLQGADLSGLTVAGKDLRLAGLRGCDLRDADLSRCDLRGADLRECRMEGANLLGASIDQSTRIGGVDLGKGLANLSSLILLLAAVGGDPEETQTQALIAAIVAAI